MNSKVNRHWYSLIWGLSSSIVFGCASIIGVEEANCDPDFDPKCGPTSSDTSDVSPETSSTSPETDTRDLAELQRQACEEYCADVIDACEETPQFLTESGCMTICENMYSYDESEAGLQGNTVQCRAQSARLALDFADGREQYCVTAGPMGIGCGGTACDNYCSAMERFCPEDFETIPDCKAACREVPRSEPYVDSFPNSNSLECRVYHIQLSVVSSPQRLLHCGHAAGRAGPCAAEE